jgi:aspartyl protease family protein
MSQFDRQDRDVAEGSRGMVAWAFRQLVLWGVFIALIGSVAGWVSGLVQDAPKAGSETAAAAATEAPAESVAVSRGAPPPNSLLYKADNHGHVLIDAEVNGVPLKFLVDTGATLVALSRADAAAIGIGTGGLAFNETVITANGRARAAAVTLREIRLGQLVLYDVPAMVNDNLPGPALLGMSFLSRLQSYEMRDGELTINW